MRRAEFILALLWILGCLVSCRYPQPDWTDTALSAEARDSLRHLYTQHYTYNTNLLVRADSVDLEVWPVKGRYERLYRGDRVVVAEFATRPADAADSVWVKLAHSEQVQGWLPAGALNNAFIPDDSLSQAIYLFSDTHVSYCVVVCALCVVVWLVRAFRRKRLRTVFYDDIDSLYPLTLCLLVAVCATLYESVQVFAPDTWMHYYYNPTLSPFKVPLVLSAFLTGLWLIVVVTLAVLDVLFRRLTIGAAFSYLLGLLSICIICYFFFVWTTRVYVGYAFLLAFGVFFARRAGRSLARPRYRCGHCGGMLPRKGVCPHCGAFNE